MAIFREIDFNALPQPSRDAFAAVAKAGKGPGGAVLFEDTSQIGKQVFLSLLLMVVLLPLLYVMMVVGFGDLNHASAMMGAGEGIFMALLLFAVIYNLLALWRRMVLKRQLPFPPGKYLLPLDFVDASTGKLRIYPMRELAGFMAVQSVTRLQLNFTDKSSANIAVSGKKAMEAAVAELQRRQAEYNQAVNGGDMAALARLDPFFAARRNEWRPAAPGASAAEALPKVLDKRLLTSAGTAVLVCAAYIPAYNFLSDNKLFEAAKAGGTEKTYQAYLTKGWRHKEEINAGMPQVVFADAKKLNTVSAYRNFLRRYPASPLKPDADKAIAGLYRATLDRFSKVAATSDPTLLPFMESLLKVLEADGRSSVQIRFIRPTTEVLEKTDRDLQGKKAGAKSLPIEPITPHFRADTAVKREERIVKELDQAFKLIFPADILNLSQPAKVDPALPVFDIAYSVLPSGATYTPTDGASTMAFVGIAVRFDANFQVPRENVQRKLNFEVQPPTMFTVSYTTRKGVGSASASNVYSTMADRAFDELSGKIRASFFKAQAPAPAPAALKKG